MIHTSSSLSNNNLSPSLLTLSNSLDKAAKTVLELIRGFVGVLKGDETLVALLVRSDAEDDVENDEEGCLECVGRLGGPRKENRGQLKFLASRQRNPTYSEVCNWMKVR